MDLAGSPMAERRSVILKNEAADDGDGVGVVGIFFLVCYWRIGVEDG